MSKYFITDDYAIACCMKALLNMDYMTFHDEDKDRYSFIKTSNINFIYGQAKNIVEDITKKYIKNSEFR